MKNILAIETSSPVLSVALKQKEGAVEETKIMGFLKHTENLLPMVNALLKKNKLALKDIHAFVIGRGPGSFTGLRIGFACLKGFLANKEKPCFGVLSFDAIAQNIQHADTKNLAVCIDARRQKFYIALYEKKKTSWKQSLKPQVINHEDLASFIPSDTTVTGDALDRHTDLFKDLQSDKVLSLRPEADWYPKAETLIHLFENNFNGTKIKRPITQLKSPADFLPYYFRLSEPEERRKENAAHA